MMQIAASARHCHLSIETYAALFGNAPMQIKRPLNQPGEFLSCRKIEVSAPNGKTFRVSVLGPYRNYDQIEVSKSEAVRFGLTGLPVRMSGHTAGAPLVRVRAVFGGTASGIEYVSSTEVDIPILHAQRHVHLSGATAVDRQIVDGESLQLSIVGGKRSMILGEVIAKVSDQFIDEIHLDTDEANACNLDGCLGFFLRKTPYTL